MIRRDDLTAPTDVARSWEPLGVLTAEDVGAGAAALIVKLVDALASREGCSIAGLVGAKLAKVVSDYRENEVGTRRRTITEVKLGEISKALGARINSSDRAILRSAFSLESSRAQVRRVGRGSLLFGLKPSEAQEMLEKARSDRRYREPDTPQNVRHIMQNLVLKEFRRAALDEPSIGNRRRSMPGEPLAKAILALASAEMKPFSDLEDLDICEVVSESALVVGWLAFHAKDSIDLSVALVQARRSDAEAKRASPLMNRFQLEFLFGELNGQAPAPERAFKAIGSVPVGKLEPLPNVIRAIEVRYAKSFMKGVVDPHHDVVHDGMTLVDWLIKLRNRAATIGAHDSVPVGDASIIEVAEHHFVRAKARGDQHAMERCRLTAFAAFGDMCFRMDTNARTYSTPGTRKLRSEMQTRMKAFE